MTDLIEKSKALTSTDVRSCIQDHFGSGGERYAVLFEVRNGTAFKANRSVDAVVMSLWPSLGLELWGMEIKVSRGDWLRELREPGKASEVFDYFDRWFLVAPSDVAKPDELPEPWGWFIPENGKLRKARDGSLNRSTKQIDRDFLAALLRRTAKTDDAFVSKQVSAALDIQRKQFESDFDRRILERQGPLKAAAEEWAKFSELLKEKPSDWIYQPDVISALRVIMKSGVAGSFGGLRSLAAEAKRVQDNLFTIAGELGISVEDPVVARRKRTR